MRFLHAARRVDHRRRSFVIASVFVLAFPCALSACVTPDPTNANPQTAAGGHLREVDFEHEPCEPNGDSKTVDVDGHKPDDIVHVMKDGREVCRIVDLNFDGSVDVYIYYDEKGAERRREADFDRDGRPDQVSIYQGGQLVENRRETNFDDKIDTWDYYKDGVLVRRERDSDGDALIDQWWTFYDPARPKCATVATDRNADSKPDAETQVDLCGTGYVSPAATVPGTVPAASTASAAPGAGPAPAAPGAAAPAPSGVAGGAATAPAPTTPSPAPAPNP